MGNKWEDNGVMMGNDGIGMGNTQRFTKSSLGLLFSRSGVKQGKTGCGKAIAKKCRKNKKTLESRSLVCFPRSYFSLLSDVTGCDFLPQSGCEPLP